MSRVEIVEVGPRDGLQNETSTLSEAQRFEFIKHLADSGLRRIEVGAFVSPKWVPQMAGSASLIQTLEKRRKEFPKEVRFSALVPNPRGMEDALQTSIAEVAVFGACSESFSKKNINCTVDESLERFRQVAAVAKRERRKVRGYLSVAFGCPYEGPTRESTVLRLIERYFELGFYEISVGDTIGVATPKQVRSLLRKIKARWGLRKIAMHFHDTRGTALANVLASLDLGVRVFDASFGGLGGCPYAKGASGNLSTEDLVYMLEGMGIKTGVNLEYLLSQSSRVAELVGHALPSRMAQAGMPYQR